MTVEGTRRPVLVSALAALIAFASPAAGQHTAGEPPRDRPKIGLALAGGGARGCAHIGVLQVLEEMGIPVDYVAGTSMGAVVGGLYAVGYSADELERLVTSIDWSQTLRDRPPRTDLSFRRKEDGLRYAFDLELGFQDGKLSWPRGLSAGQNLFFLLRSYTQPVAAIDDFDRLAVPFRAIAADIQTGDKVVLGDGDLARAIRASMAIPGYFTPVEIDGRTLVDGGVVDNLPIDEVRRMGADVVIAVLLNDPLAEAEVDSMVKIVGQTRAMLTKRAVDPQLARAEVVLQPDVTRFSILNFEVAGDIVSEGLKEARAHAGELRRYALRAPYRGENRQPIPSSVTVDAVRLEGESRVDRRIIDANLDVRTGEVVDFDQLADSIARLYGLGDFESIEYAIEQGEDGDQSLVLQLRDKPWGPRYLHFGINLESDVDGDLALALLVNYTTTRLNARGAEWRTDLQLGTDRKLFTEFYQPLDFHGEWFVAPRAEIERDRLRVFEGDVERAELDVRRAEVGLDVGYQFGEYGEIRLGLARGRADVDVATGSIDRRLDEVDFGALVLQATLDRLDSAIVPSRGNYAQLRVFRAEESLGAEHEYTKLELRGARFWGRGRHTFLAGAGGGWSPGDGLPFYDEFRVGGLWSFSGYQEDQLRGQDYGVVRAGYLYELSRGGAFFRRLVVGGWLEAGNVWAAAESPDLGELIYTGTVALGADSLIGPVFLAYGYADEGTDRLYLGIGRSF